MSLKLGEYAQISEIVSAVAVVASLLYVGYELNQNTSATETNARIESQRVFYSFNDMNLQNPDLIDLGMKTYDPKVQFSSFEGVESVRVALFVRSQLQRYTELFVRHEVGYLSEEFWGHERAVLAGYIRDLPVWKEVWSRDRDIMPRGFVTHVESAEPVVHENFIGK